MDNFKNTVDRIFERYPIEVRRDIVRAGVEFAAPVMLDKQYGLFDTVVSDWSCQTRTIWLACLLKKKTFDDLVEEDFIIFGLVKLLIDSAMSVEHCAIGKFSIKTRTAFWPDYIMKLKNKRYREQFYGEAKQMIAMRVVGDLHSWFCDIPFNYIATGSFKGDKKGLFEEHKYLSSHPFHAVFTKILTPTIPFFFGYVVVFSLAAYYKVPVCSIVRTVEDIDNKQACTNIRYDYFCYDDNSQTFKLDKSIPEKNKDDACIAVYSYRYLDRKVDYKKPIDDFLNSLFNTDFSFLDFIYLIAATHKLIPNGDFYNLSCVPKSMEFLNFFGERATDVGCCSLDTVKQVVNEKDYIIEKTPFNIVHVKSHKVSDLENDHEEIC